MQLSFCEAGLFLEVLSCNACFFVRLLWICQSRPPRSWPGGAPPSVGWRGSRSGGRARGTEPPSGGRQGQGRGCIAQGEERYVVGVMSAEFFVRCLVSDLLLFRAGGLHQGQRGAAEAPRGGRSAGGRHRGEASPGAGGSARYDPEIICYVLFVMFFGLG